MPHIETTEDLINDLADKLGIYGGCKASNSSCEDPKGCENENPHCCRVGFHMVMQERIYKAVENDKLLNII